MIAKALVVFVLAGLGVASAQSDLAETNRQIVEQTSVPSRAPPAIQFENSEDAVAAYRRGWAATMEQLRASDAKLKRTSIRLDKLLGEVRPVMAWGHLQDDGTMSALSNGSRSGVWVIVVDPGNPRLEQVGPTMTTVDESGITVIMVRPDLLTERWAGIFLIHEMSHALDHRDAPDKNGCALEFDAYRVERETFNRLTEARFDKILDAEITQQGYTSVGDLLRALNHPSQDEFAAVLDSIERKLSEPEALSAAEREMRDGFFLMSLVDRIGENRGLDTVERCRDMSAVISAASKY